MLPLLLIVPLAMATEPTAVKVDYHPTEPWPVGQKLYVAGPEGNLRAAASTDAPVVTELDLGTPVIVQSVMSADVDVGGRTDRWYAIKAEDTGKQGVLFGGVLTPARLDVDLDQDGEAEVLVLTWGWDTHKVVRVREPALSGAGAVTQLDMGQTNDIEGPQVEMFLRVTAAADTGIPLVHVTLNGREMCGSGSSGHYVSYRSEGPGALGVLREAVDEHSWGDAPVYSRQHLAFYPADKAVTVRSEMGNYDEGTETVTEERRVLQDGVFVAEGPAD